MHKFTIPVFEVFWLYGSNMFSNRMSSNWTSVCAHVMIAQNVKILPVEDIPQSTRKRTPTTPAGSFDNIYIYIDAIGVPRGVPNEYIAAGF